MSSDGDSKMFVGGVLHTTSQEALKIYFEKFGVITQCTLMKDRETGRSRGFGFITFQEASSVDEVMNNCPHKLDDRIIDPKRNRKQEVNQILTYLY